MLNGKRKPIKSRLCAVRMTPQDWKRLENIQKRTGATPSAQMRLAVDLWLKQQEAGR